MISCPNCGGNPRFDIASQKLLCSNCGSYFDVESFPEEQSGANMQTVSGEYTGEPGKMQVKIYTCSQCGGELMSMDTDATAFCSYCGSHQILEERLSMQERPKRIIPFKITKDDCKKAYEKRLKRSLFAPRELKDPAYIDEFRSIYMPYWYYDFSQKGNISLSATTESRSGNYKIIDSYKLSVDADNYYNGITHDASTSFDDKMSESLAPYDTRQTVPFSTSYLSGFYADIPDVEKTTYQLESAMVAARETLDRIGDFKEFSPYTMKEMNDIQTVDRTLTKASLVESAMLPVWFLSYRKDDRVAYAAINGQTGKMTADIPIDPKRYLLGVGIVAAVIWIILQTFNIASLRGIVLAVVFGAMAGTLVYGMILYKLQEDINNREWENHMRERFLKKKEKAENSEEDTEEDKEKKKRGRKKNSNIPVKSKGALGIMGTAIFWGVLLIAAGVTKLFDVEWLIAAEPVIAAAYVYLAFDDTHIKRGKISNFALCAATVIGTLVWFFNPYIDILYYGSCILMMAGVVWCFFDALYYYNQLMTRPLPQFNKKGGDDRA